MHPEKIVSRIYGSLVKVTLSSKLEIIHMLNTGK